jgi:hypothetical protein
MPRNKFTRSLSLAMNGLRRLQRWQTTILILARPGQRVLLRPDPTALPIRPIHVLAARGAGLRATEVAEAAEAVEGEEVEGAEDGVKIGAVRKALDQKAKGSTRGQRRAAQIISSSMFHSQSS